VTTTENSKDDIVATVPQSALLSVDQAEKIESLKKILDGDEMLCTMENVALALTIAHERLRGKESEWAPYINILPSKCQTPIFYNVEQIQVIIF
jgi:hypothetical protein